jgi:hypothetical protein
MSDRALSHATAGDALGVLQFGSVELGLSAAGGGTINIFSPNWGDRWLAGVAGLSSPWAGHSELLLEVGAHRITHELHGLFGESFSHAGDLPYVGLRGRVSFRPGGWVRAIFGVSVVGRVDLGQRELTGTSAPGGTFFTAGTTRTSLAAPGRPRALETDPAGTAGGASVAVMVDVGVDVLLGS